MGKGSGRRAGANDPAFKAAAWPPESPVFRRGVDRNGNTAKIGNMPTDTENRRMVGTMEDVGDTYPVCDACGAIGEGRLADGDPCRACLADPQPARLPGGAH